MSSSLPQHLQDEAHFADEHYAKWADHLDMNPQLFRAYAEPRDMWDWRQRAGSYLGNLTGLRVLDYGCGQGEEAVYLAKMGAHVTAIDVSPVGVEITRKRAAHNGVAERVDARVMRCDPTEFPAQSFDVIHGFGIIHHVGVTASFDEVRRLLKPGGRGVFLEHMGNSALVDRIQKIKSGDYTEHERPVRWDELLAEAPKFASFHLHPYHLTSRVRKLRHTRLFRQLDHAALSAVPSLRHFASGVVIALRAK